MIYALASNDQLKEYPFTLEQLRQLYPDVSFPADYNADLQQFGFVQVRETTCPQHNHTVNIRQSARYIDTEWVQVWLEDPASDSEIQKRTENRELFIRTQRNNLLANCDWTQLPDAPVDATAWTVYRQELRDVTKQTEFPWVVAWPIMPEA